MAEKQHARDYANQIFTHVSNEYADSADLGLYLARVIAELLELSPVAREHVSDLILVDLTEELHRRGGPGRNAARMVSEVQRNWMRGQ